MEDFVQYFAELSTATKLIWVTVCMSFFWLLESAKPLFKFQYKKWNHAGKNFIYLLFTFVINLLMGIAATSAFIWADQTQFGLLRMIEIPTWLALLLTVMWIDLVAQYSVHYLLHRVKWMWRFHMIHHSDTTVDVTTGTRHHPGDYLIREVLALSATIVFGAPFAFYMLYRMCSIFFTYFTHANVEFPVKLDKVLALVFITPNVHKFHHHYQLPWTDTNFGNIFSFWDRIFGTFVYENPKDIVFGLDTLDPKTANDVAFQLKIPFSSKTKTDV